MLYHNYTNFCMHMGKTGKPAGNSQCALLRRLMYYSATKMLSGSVHLLFQKSGIPDIFSAKLDSKVSCFQKSGINVFVFPEFLKFKFKFMHLNRADCTLSEDFHFPEPSY